MKLIHKNIINLESVLETLTRDELRMLANDLNIPRPPTKKDLIQAIVAATKEKKAIVKSSITIKDANGNVLMMKSFTKCAIEPDAIPYWMPNTIAFGIR